MYICVYVWASVLEYLDSQWSVCHSHLCLNVTGTSLYFHPVFQASSWPAVRRWRLFAGRHVCGKYHSYCTVHNLTTCTVLRGRPALYFLSLTRFPVILSPLMASSLSHSFYCLYWILLRRKGIGLNSPLGDTSDLIRYPARRFAFWKTTEKGPWWNYRHSGQPVQEGKDFEFQWSPLLILYGWLSQWLSFQLQWKVSKLTSHVVPDFVWKLPVGIITGFGCCVSSPCFHYIPGFKNFNPVSINLVVILTWAFYIPNILSASHNVSKLHDEKITLTYWALTVFCEIT